PGTSIAWVHREAEADYARIQAELEALVDDSLRALTGPGDAVWEANAGPLPVAGGAAMVVTASGSRPGGVTAETDGDGIVLTGEYARLVVGPEGTITSLVDLATGREAVAEGSALGVAQVFRDIPNQWDAWDIDADYRLSGVTLSDVDQLEVVRDGVGSPEVLVRRSFGSSTLTQRIALAGDRAAVVIRTDVDWHERQRLLKLGFGLDVHAERATSEIQFGHVHRPIHANTSWDAARFETPAQRWVHVGEAGYGFAVVNDAMHGHDIARTTRAGGGTTTTVRQSLLRAPLFPDPEADQGQHSFTTVLRLGATIADAVEEGYRLFVPPRRVRGGAGVAPLVAIDGGGAIVEAVKLAEDGSGDVVVRLYESLGGRAHPTLTLDPLLDAASAVRTDLHEDPAQDPTERLTVDGRRIGLELRPFEIVTLRIPRLG
ncbi:MAG: alpha-mannosidase, partial [Propionibacterium sp.]|nr:alpha-mannosidase [Propionibacterium sp.]